MPEAGQFGRWLWDRGQPAPPAPADGWSVTGGNAPWTFADAGAGNSSQGGGGRPKNGRAGDGEPSGAAGVENGAPVSRRWAGYRARASNPLDTFSGQAEAIGGRWARLAPRSAEPAGNRG